MRPSATPGRGALRAELWRGRAPFTVDAMEPAEDAEFNWPWEPRPQPEQMQAGEEVQAYSSPDAEAFRGRYFPELFLSCSNTL